MSDDELLASVKPRAATAPTVPASPQSAPDYSAMSDDDLLASVKPRAAPAGPRRSAGEELGRQIGLTVRHAVNGVAAIPAMAADAVAGVANKGLDVAMGDGKGFRFASNQAKALDNFLTKTGLPQPENAVERVVGDAASALAGTAGAVKAGQILARGAGSAAQAAQTSGRIMPPSPSNVTEAVGQGLALNPAMQGVSAVTSAGASGLTREAGGGEAAQIAAGVAGAIAPSVIAPRRVVTDAGRQTRAAAEQASSNGYVIPPADLSPGLLSEGLSGFSGKIKTAQVASAKNQTVSNSLARKALGIGDDVDLNIDTLEALRKKAAGAYAPVAGAGTVTPTKTYTDALDDAIKPFVSQSKSFPGMKVPEVVNDIAALRSPQFDAGDALNAIRTMREGADKAYRAGEAQSGKAYRAAASALEDALETHLQGLGQPGADILKGFRDARQQIAKTWTVQNALNPSTGNVNAIKLAADLAKNKPLSGELRTVAEFGQAFPKAAQALKEAPNATSPLDWFGGTAAAAGTGNVLPLAAVAARPAVRAGLLSGPMQRLAIRNAGTEVKRVPEGAGAIAAGVAGRAAQAEDPPPYRNRLQAGAAARASGGVVVPVPGGFAVQPR